MKDCDGWISSQQFRKGERMLMFKNLYIKLRSQFKFTKSKNHSLSVTIRVTGMVNEAGKIGVSCSIDNPRLIQSKHVRGIIRVKTAKWRGKKHSGKRGGRGSRRR